MKLDLVIIAALAKRVALLPVVGKADAMSEQEAAACVEAVWHMLAEPHEYVAGLNPVETYRWAPGQAARRPSLKGMSSAEAQGLSGSHACIAGVTVDV